MNCRDVKNRLSAYLDNAISPELSESIQKHLEICPDCQRESDELSQAYSFLVLWSSEENIPSLEFVRPVDKNADKNFPALQKRFFKWAAMAACLIGMLIGSAAGLILKMEPENTVKIDKTAVETYYIRNWGMSALEELPPGSVEQVYMVIANSNINSGRD